MPSWWLWLDDQSTDPSTPNRHPPKGYLPACSTEEAKQLVLRLGMPSLMDLDHDLGGEDTAMVFLKWLAYEFTAEIPPPPAFHVHSANPNGAKNITAFMRSWEKAQEM